MAFGLVTVHCAPTRATSPSPTERSWTSPPPTRRRSKRRRLPRTDACRMTSSAKLVLASAALMLSMTAPAQGLFPGDSGAQFTSEQAARGQGAYARACLNCHGAVLEGNQFGPPLKGEAFASHWRGRTRAALAEKIRTTMPP